MQTLDEQPVLRPATMYDAIVKDKYYEFISDKESGSVLEGEPISTPKFWGRVNSTYTDGDSVYAEVMLFDFHPEAGWTCLGELQSILVAGPKQRIFDGYYVYPYKRRMM